MAQARPPVPGPRPPGAAGRRTRAAWRGGALAGVLAVAGLALVSHVPGDPGSGPTAAVAVRLAPSGELASDRSAPMIRSGALGASPVAGALTVRNRTGTTLDLGVRATADSEDLDGALHISVAIDGVALADGSLAALRRGVPARARLQPGRPARLTARAWLDPALAEGAGGRAADVTLTLTATPAPA